LEKLTTGESKVKRPTLEPSTVPTVTAARMLPAVYDVAAALQPALVAEVQLVLLQSCPSCNELVTVSSDAPKLSPVTVTDASIERAMFLARLAKLTAGELKVNAAPVPTKPVTVTARRISPPA
jgi:hypothetical protein